MSSIGGGWTLIGEKGKYIALSPQRFVNNTFGSTAAKTQQVTVRGSPGEQVDVMLVPPTTVDKQLRCVAHYCRQPLRGLLASSFGRQARYVELRLVAPFVVVR